MIINGDGGLCGNPESEHRYCLNCLLETTLLGAN